MARHDWRTRHDVRMTCTSHGHTHTSPALPAFMPKFGMTSFTSRYASCMLLCSCCVSFSFLKLSYQIEWSNMLAQHDYMEKANRMQTTSQHLHIHTLHVTRVTVTTRIWTMKDYHEFWYRIHAAGGQKSCFGLLGKNVRMVKKWKVHYAKIIGPCIYAYTDGIL